MTSITLWSNKTFNLCYCSIHPSYTDTEKEDSTLDDEEESSGDEGGDGGSEDSGGEIFCLLTFISSGGVEIVVDAS